MSNKVFLCMSFLILSILSQNFQEIDKIFEHYNKPMSPGCQVAIHKNGQTIFQKGYGFRNIEERLSNNERNLHFALASISKQFTGLSIAILAEEGKLSEDDSIKKYLPHINTHGHDIKIHHLLHHTSGYKSYEAARLLSDKDLDYWSEEEALDLIQRQKGLSFPPGEKHEYSNTGYYLLAKIIEKVSGQKFKQFANDNIFKPLGMNNTFILDEFNEIIPRMTYSYQYIKDVIMKDMKSYDKAVIGSAGIISTLEDMSKYDRNFFNNRLGRGGQRLIDRWLTRRTLNNGELNTYAYGVTVDKFANQLVVYHTGSISGYRSNYLIFPNLKSGFFFLCNHERTDLLNYSQKLAGFLLGMSDFNYKFREYDSELIEKRKDVVLKSTDQNLSEYQGFYVSTEIKAIYELITLNGLLKLPHKSFGDLHFRVLNDDSFVCQEISKYKGKFIRKNQKISGFSFDANQWRNISFVKNEKKPDCFDHRWDINRTF